MNRQTDMIDKVAAAHAKQEAKTARQKQRHETIKEMEEPIVIIAIAMAVVIAITVVMVVVYLLNSGPDDSTIVREKNFKTCVEKGATFVPLTENKYACIYPPAP